MSQYYEKAVSALKEGDWKVAYALVLQGVENDCGMCTWWLGNCYDEGYWVEKDKAKADELFEKGAKLGNTRCMAEILKQFEISSFWYDDVELRKLANKLRDRPESELIINGNDEYAKGQAFVFLIASMPDYFKEKNIDRPEDFFLKEAAKGCIFST